MIDCSVQLSYTDAANPANATLQKTQIICFVLFNSNPNSRSVTPLEVRAPSWKFVNHLANPLNPDFRDHLTNLILHNMETDMPN